MKVGRPKLQAKVHRYNVTFSLREGEDDDLIAFFESLPDKNRVQGIKNALRDGDTVKNPRETEAERTDHIVHNVLDNIL